MTKATDRGVETGKTICPRKHSYTIEAGLIHVSWPHERWTFCGDTDCVQALGAAIAEAQSHSRGSPILRRYTVRSPPQPDKTSDHTTARQKMFGVPTDLFADPGDDSVEHDISNLANETVREWIRALQAKCRAMISAKDRG